MWVVNGQRQGVTRVRRTHPETPHPASPEAGFRYGEATPKNAPPRGRLDAIKPTPPIVHPVNGLRHIDIDYRR